MDAAGPPLRADRFSTAGIAPARRFEACRARVAGWKDLRPSDDGADDFALETAAWRFGPLSLARTRGAHGAVNTRDAARARRDGLDHWAVSVLRAGAMGGECGGAAFAAEAGVPHAYGLHLPHRIARGAAEWVTLFVPRDAAAPDLAAALDARRRPVVTLGGPLGALLGEHLRALPAALGGADAGAAGAAAGATLALLRAAAAVATGQEEPDEGDALPQALRPRLLALVRREMPSSRLCPARLARLAGVSRTRLYEVFAPEGGVARAIQRERLRAAARALADPAERRAVARIAEDLGMPDPSVFSRSFRREFGLSPREHRARALSLGAAPTR